MSYLLKQVLEIEEKAEEGIQEAKLKAKEILDKAEEEGKKIVEEIKKATEERIGSYRAEAENKCKIEESNLRVQGEEEVRKIREVPLQNIEAMADYLLEKFKEYCK
ncbi:MAG: hypothetical protein N3G21_06635 [Candidatus Hydrogenedentes bacterium]|nr:hypothetical protein [Candidatus Hydrogenedentota bacterium]